MKLIKNMTSMLWIAATAMILSSCDSSINPILTDAYAADPSAIVFGDTLFVYPSHDQNAGENFNMEDYHCYYTTDMKHFSDGGVIFRPLEQTTWVKNRAWGPQCVRKMVPKSDTDTTRVMRYFFYYSGNASEIGVAVSDSPFGPFEDPLGEPFFTTDTPGIHCDRDFIDPHCFIDDDGQAYLFMGQNTVNAVRLNDDMISYDHTGGVLDENGNETGVYHIDAPNFFEAICCHKYNGKYYLSYANPYNTDHPYQLEYCIGDNPLGPYEHKGKFMDAQDVLTNEHSIVEFKGQWWLFYHNAFVGAATGAGDQTFSRRSMCADRLYYNEDGTIKLVVPTRNERKFRKAVKTLTLPKFFQPVSQEEMQPVFEQVSTPVKHGIVVMPENPDCKADSPSVFRHDGKWYMTWIMFDGKGYETWLSESDNLRDWTTLGKIMSYTDDTWDKFQKAGYIALQDIEWGGSYEMQKYNGKYWMSYLGGCNPGYETEPLMIGLASSGTLGEPVEWECGKEPILSPMDEESQWFEERTQYKSCIIEDKDCLTGHRFVIYYNAKGQNPTVHGPHSKTPGFTAERIGIAFSDDLKNWSRYRYNPVLAFEDPDTITGDPQIQKIGDLYVMFYFRAFDPESEYKAYNSFACSRDLIHWYPWEGESLIHPSKPYDNLFAHKSYVVRWNDVTYHFYCAVNESGERGIALATSE